MKTIPRTKRWRTSQANQEFYQQHAEELWKEHDGKQLLIYNGGTLEVFDDFDQLMERFVELDDHARESALHMWQLPEGTLVL